MSRDTPLASYLFKEVYMGYREAVEDGIRQIGSIYQKQYVIPCSKCGVKMTSWSYDREKVYRCKECKLIEQESKNNLTLQTKLRKLKTAILRIEKQGNNIKDYKNAITEITKILDKQGWFQSTEEIMVALQLYKRKIPFNHQVKIKSYRADFVLPKDHIILEVDGILFHTDKTKPYEIARDKLIKDTMGKEWEVIRVTDTDINERIKKLPLAIRLKYKNKQRGKTLYNGKVVYNYKSSFYSLYRTI